MTSESSQYLYGRRVHVTQNVTAQPTYNVRPLERDDFLNPVEGDDFVHGERHAADVARLAAQLRHHFRYNPATTVVEGAIIRWRMTGLAAPMPDIALVDDLPDPSRRLATLDLESIQASVRAIFEVTSPLFADYDLRQKVEIYRQAGILEYWVIDTGIRPDHTQPDYQVFGWQLENGAYIPIDADADGRYHSAACRIWLRTTEDHQGFEIGDSRTDQPIEPGEDDARANTARAEASARAQSIADQLKF